MALFVVRHQHPAERCPAHDPSMGQMLLNHLSAPNAEQNGVKLYGEAVLNGQHTLYMIAEADNQATLDAFMQPFQQAGSVEIWPASSCEAVVERGGCGIIPG